MSSSDVSVGDIVVVRSGVSDPDMGADLGGWQGRVIGIHPGEQPPTLDIQWDSITLRSMAPEVIERCEEEGLDWTQMCLEVGDVMVTDARDSEHDVAAVKAELAPRYTWFSLGGEQGRNIQRVVSSAEGRDEAAVFAAWQRHLEAHLTFPFAATLSDNEYGPMRQGDRLRVTGITFLDETYGIIVSVTHGRGVSSVPLCDLTAEDTTSPNHDLVDDYSTWFTNR